MNNHGDGCSKCGRPYTIVNRRHWLCQQCNYKRLHGHDPQKKPIAKKRFSSTFDYCTDWAFDSEKDLFTHMMNERGPGLWSEISGEPIPDPGPHNFAHILAKGLNKYPHFRFNPANICIMTMHEHHLWDNGTKQERQEYADSIARPGAWDQLEARAEILKELYRLRFNQ